MVEFVFGPYAFTFSGTYSGYGPTELRGPDRTMHVVEHQIPAREGGIVEYLGSQQSTYQFRGFVTQQENGSTAALVLSGASWVALNADDAKDFIKLLRGSGVQLLKVESTYSNQSGYQVLYENGFFLIEKMTLGFEAGRSYPYYPYSIDFRGATPATYGNSSGTTTFPAAAGNYFSGFIRAWQMQGPSSGTTIGQVINTVGVYVNTVASGNIRVGVYSGTTAANATLVAQSSPQAVHSGWNYLPIRPSFASQSGYGYILAFAGDAANTSGFTVAEFNAGASFDSSVFSGYNFANDFPAFVSTVFNVSGIHFDIVMVAGV